MSASIATEGGIFHNGVARLAVNCVALLASVCGCANGKDRDLQAILQAASHPEPGAASRVRPFLDHADGDVRTAALVALAAVAPQEAAERLGVAMADPAPGVRAAAARIAGETGDSRVAGALEGLARNDPEGHVRLRATEALSRIGGEGAVAALGAGLADPSVAVRTAAAKGLASGGAAAWVAQLSKVAVEDVSWETRVEAVKALGSAAVPEAYPALDLALSDPNEFVRAAAARTITALVGKGIERRSPSPDPGGPGPSP